MTISCTALYTARDRRNYRLFSWWITGAAFVFSASTIVIGEKWVGPGVLAWSLTAVTILLFLASLRAYIRFVRNADELLRKVHLDSLALAFGVGAIAMLGYRLCERLGAPRLDVDDPVLLMIITWALGQYLGQRRYAVPEEQ